MITWLNMCYGKLTSVESHLVKQTFLSDPCVYIQTQRPQSELFPPHVQNKVCADGRKKDVFFRFPGSTRAKTQTFFLLEQSFRHVNCHKALSNLKAGKLQFNYGLFGYFRVLECHPLATLPPQGANLSSHGMVYKLHSAAHQRD